MLTFPTLNGLAFIFSRHDAVSTITATMLLMPLLNGLLCLVYIAAFITLTAAQHATALAWGLAVVIALLWLAVATRPWFRCGIAPRLQQFYVLAIALIGAGLTLVWWRYTGSVGADTNDVAKPALTWFKIVLFAIAVFLLTVLPPRFQWKDGDFGILSGLPLVVLAGLLNVAQDCTIDLDVRRELLVQMMLGVWLAPSMAVAFILGVSRVLASQRAHDLRVFVVGAGWGLCLTAILVTGAALQWLASWT